jgi:hypothetical protein
MAARQRIWAAHARKLLRRALGMKCAACGSKDYRKLEFDCIKPCGDRHHKMEWSWRISFYREQFRAGNLQLLCGGVGGCHGKKTAKDLNL